MQGPGRDGMIAPDERLEAFLSLLRAPPASSAHLALLDDNTLYGSLAFYLSSLAEPAQAARLVRAVACSGALWASPTPRLVAEGSEGILPTRAHNLSRAVAQATTRRLDLLLRARLGASGWGTQRALGQWVHALVQAAESDDLVGAATGGSVDDDASGTTLLAAWTAAGADPHLAGLYGTPLPRLAILTGLFLGLNAVGEERSGGTRPSKGVSLRKIKATVESEWLTTLGHSVVMIQRVLSTASQGPSGPQDASDDAWEKEFARRLVVMEPSPYPATWTLAARRTVWEATFLLVGQAGQYVSEKRVRALLPAVPLAQVASDAIVGLYEQYDLPTVIDLGGHGVPAKLEALRQDRIYPWLGPLSRVTSYALGQTVLELTPDEALDLILGTGSEKVVPSLLKRIEDMSAALSHAWAQSPLSSSPSGEDQRVKDQIWTELRRFVFSSTMLFEALVESLVDMVPSPTESIALPDVEAPNEFHAATASNIPAPYLTAVQSCLHTYGRMYFVVNVFGSDTLTAYKRVFYSCLDLLQRDAQASLHFLLAIFPSGPSGQGTEQGSLSQKVFYLDAAEQLVSAAPDSLIERQVLPLAHPFLESNKAPNAFESAHSLVLAIFANRKALCRDFAPYYVPLLLKLYPGTLSTQQFQLAFAVLVDTISSVDDAEAMWALSQLQAAVDDGRTALSKGQYSSADLSVLQSTYAAQLASINLVLFRRVLSVVHDWILEISPAKVQGKTPESRESQGEKEERHHALCTAVWDALGRVDASAQEEGFRWWTQNRAKFGLPVTKL